MVNPYLTTPLSFNLMTHDIFSYPRYLPSSDHVLLCTIISSHLRVNIPLITILPIYLFASISYYSWAVLCFTFCLSGFSFEDAFEKRLCMEWGPGFGHMEFTNSPAFCGFIYILSGSFSVGLGERTGKKDYSLASGLRMGSRQDFLPRGFCTGAALETACNAIRLLQYFCAFYLVNMILLFCNAWHKLIVCDRPGLSEDRMKFTDQIWHTNHIIDCICFHPH